MTRNVRTFASGLGFTEGPVVTPDDRIFVTSVDRGLVYEIIDGVGIVAGDVGGGANGATIGANGTLYVTQNGGRLARNGPIWRPDSVGGVQTISPDGEIGWLTQEPIAPNDLCFGPDGLLYMTDPTRAYHAADGRIWRVDPSDGGTELVRSVRWFTNGIAFGPDDRLYIAATHHSRIVRLDIETGEEEVVIQMTEGKPDGLAFDADGNVVLAAIVEDHTRGSIQTWSLDGEELDRYYPPSDSDHYTNVAFTRVGDLLITDASAGALLIVEGWGAGLPLHPFRG